VDRARAIATGHGRTALLYSCNSSGCLQLDQVVRNDLETLGLNVETRTFDHETLYAKISARRAPFDLAFATWLPDWPDPAAMLNGMLANSSSFYPTFNESSYTRAAAAAGRLSGPRRYLAFGRLAARLARESAPIVAYGNNYWQEFFSPRIGCQTYSFYNAADVASLCLRRRQR
jgi:ABC-type oligopeptide transport system substrate-binding subunit